MGSAAFLDPNPRVTVTSDSRTIREADSAGMKGKKSNAKPKSTVASKNVKMDVDVDVVASTDVNEKKRSGQIVESNTSHKRPKRAAACSDFKPKSIRLSDKSDVIEVNNEQRLVEDEISGVRLTSGPDEPRQKRRLTNFILHDENGVPKSFEMSEVQDILISGTILTLRQDSSIIKAGKEKGLRCEGFGRIEAWTISGYDEGSPVIWISTHLTDYYCLNPATGYKNQYDRFYEKARVCVEVYKKLCKSSGGNPDLSLVELLAGVVRSMRTSSRSFSGGMSAARDFIISQGDFIYNQLIGLDVTSSITDHPFSGMRSLISLREQCRNNGEYQMPAKMSTCGSLVIKGGGVKADQSAEEDKDQKLARLLQEEEIWNTTKKLKRNTRAKSGSNNFYIKINEDEIANDYPLPAFYKTSMEETDEYLIFFDANTTVRHLSKLPQSMLHNWSLYNSDSRLISLELLPMKACDDDVMIFGSGVMTTDDGSGFCSLDSDPLLQSSCSGGASEVQNVDGIPIYLSAIKEWMIEFGSSMIFISIRTDISWFRLGKPSKQYAPWYETVLKIARVAICIITLLKEQPRASRLSFADVIKRLAELEKDNPSYISFSPVVVERYVVVHGQIILQQFAEFPNKAIRECAFVSALSAKMEERHHTKLVRKNSKKVLLKSEQNMNPCATMAPVVSKKKAMRATTTRLINRIWGDYYSNYSPEIPKEEDGCEAKEEEEDEEVEEDEENEEEEVEEENLLLQNATPKHPSKPVLPSKSSSNQETRWEGDSIGKTASGEVLYKQAIVRGDVISVGCAVTLEFDGPEEMPVIYFVEYMFEKKANHKKFVHGRVMERGSQTMLGNTSSEREVFLTNDCKEFELRDVKQVVVVNLRSVSWGHQYRKENANAYKINTAKAERRKKRGLPVEYYCKSLYWPERGAFMTLPLNNMGLGDGVCYSCKVNETQKEKEIVRVNSSKTGYFVNGVEYTVNDFVYVSPRHFHDDTKQYQTFKSGRNIGLKAYIVCELLEINISMVSKESISKSTEVMVRRFFRPEDISSRKAYSSDIREVYYSEEILNVPLSAIDGRCEIRNKKDLLPVDGPAVFEHVFFCECIYDAANGAVKKLPSDIKLNFSPGKAINDDAARKKKGKWKEGESDPVIDKKETSRENRLATLDIFAGCGGLSDGLEKAGVSHTKWAIEYEQPAGEAFKLNHPDSLMFVDNCNVILRAIMEKCGDIDDCISTPEAKELAAGFSEEKISNLPLPGQVDFINGGPPCQGFSGMNRYNQSTWSKVQCEMILAFLSFADYFRPRFFLLENVRNFVTFNKGQTFRLTVASLLEMGYQVRFGILEAGAYGVSQSRKRAFIWAAAPEATLPEWPEPMHVFVSQALKISLPGNVKYAAARCTASGAPFRSITVRDTIRDLPPVKNGASQVDMKYENDPVSWFQKQIRGDVVVLFDHISKGMEELNLIRCQRIPKRPGADWQDLPAAKVRLSNGKLVDLIPWCLPNTAKKYNQWKGLFGRLDWQGNFPTSITDPQPMGKVGMCFHPDQDRILTVRECARSQGFQDSYRFAGNISDKHRQIGNAVPPPLAFALGRKLKEAVIQTTRQ